MPAADEAKQAGGQQRDQKYQYMIPETWGNLCPFVEQRADTSAGQSFWCGNITDNHTRLGGPIADIV